MKPLFPSRREALKELFLYYSLSTVVLSLLFAAYMWGSSVIEVMDFLGWLFFATSCLSHAAVVMLLPFLLSSFMVAFRFFRVARALQVVLTILIFILTYLNMQVYALYRFHINGFVLNLLTGPGAGDIFTFDTRLYFYESLLFLLLVALALALWYATRWYCKRHRKVYAFFAVSALLTSTLLAHGIHIYGSFVQRTSVMKSAALLPYYFPTTAYSLMTKMGVEAPTGSVRIDAGGSGDVRYPVNSLQTHVPDSLPNIIFILIDSWNQRTLTPETMPNVYQFAKDNQWFTNHFSGSNGTRSGVFSLFFGLSCYYWESFEASHIKPLFIRRLLDLGYDIKAYPSAPLTNPDFARVLFSDVKDLRTETKGKTVFQRDEQLTNDYLQYLRQQKTKGKPFFSFLFYDLPHSFELTPEQNKPFAPAWEFADYTRLRNDIDPTPFFNLYRNCCRHDDQFIGQILETLKQNHLLDNTLVVVTGDHSQEFNENRRNYWGHNGNFSRWQLSVPLLFHIPGQAPRRWTHRTTHYDLVPTLMSEWLGVSNDASDYSMGHLLTDATSRNWHIVGSNLNYAFIVEGDTILEKNATGGLDVYTPDMSPLTNYRINARAYNEAIQRLNHFYK